jgi:hypothetical protein
VVKARAARGLLGFWQADYGPAVADLARALQEFRTLRADEGIAYCLGALGLVALHSGRADEGEEQLLEAQRLFVSLGDRAGAVRLANSLALARLANGDLPATDASLRETLADADGSVRPRR